MWYAAMTWIHLRLGAVAQYRRQKGTAQTYSTEELFGRPLPAALYASSPSGWVAPIAPTIQYAKGFWECVSSPGVKSMPRRSMAAMRTIPFARCLARARVYCAYHALGGCSHALLEGPSQYAPPSCFRGN